MKTTEKVRFDAKLPREQKEIFEYAARLGGFRTLTDFIFSTVQERAKKIIEEHEKIIASEKDKQLFFDAVNNPPEPNEKLMNAAKKYFEMLDEK